MRTKYIIFGKILSIRVKKFEQNLTANYSKSTKIAITACKFFRGSMPPDPLEPSCFSISFKLVPVMPKKKRLKIQISRYATGGSLFSWTVKRLQLFKNSNMIRLQLRNILVLDYSRGSSLYFKFMHFLTRSYKISFILKCGCLLLSEQIPWLSIMLNNPN